MIRSDAEYRATMKRVHQLRQQLADHQSRLQLHGLPEDQIKRELDPMKTFCVGHEEEIEEYDRIKRGRVGEFINFHNVGRMLIALRIASRLTQRELAARLGIDETQVSRWERHEYHAITLEKAADIADALRVRVTTTCEPVVNYDAA